ncbi:hypothetical protein H072_9505 [Dactylellina haptotyla CBS 200.50]|uniref:Cytochrome P450 n=1 Tax=Dactylellina haptotyla (strain CBS 200.50) TaxID=1284197 RepID=S8A710_DACHA|nr:hypothetical protein H072_9505 [Dactylellina haptotyla CBS 200.50]
MAILRILGLVFLTYTLSQIFKLLRNLQKAHKLGIPVVTIPVAQDNPIWMIISIPLRPLLKRILPDDLFTRLGVTMHGWEHNFKFIPYQKWSAPHGSPKSLVLAGIGTVELSTWDHEIIADVLRRPKDFPQFDMANFLLNRFGDNVLSTDGEVWARHRKLVASTLNEKISKVVFDQSTNLAKGLLGELLEESEPGSAAVETNRIFDLVKKLAITVLSNAGMGGNEPWKDPTMKVIKPGFKLPYIETVKGLIGNIVAAAILPPWFTRFYPSFLPGGDTMRLLSHAVREFRVHTADLIDEEKKRIASHDSLTRNNILSMLLSASKEGEKDERRSQGKDSSLSDQEIMGNLYVFTAAGFDSTANSINFCIVELLRNPFYQEWLFEEIDSILPTDPNEPVDYAATFPRAYRCLSVMLETLRLHPALVHIAKMTKSPQTIRTPTSTIQVPSGVIIYINSVVVHRDPDVWRDLNRTPLDAANDVEAERSLPDELKFRPTRWINTGTEATQPRLFQPPRGVFVPWSMGPRVCPGQKMAQVEFVAIILVLLRYHRLEAVKIKVADKSGTSREETDAELRQRLSGLAERCVSKITQEMDVYDIKDSEAENVGRTRGVRVRLVRRK